MNDIINNLIAPARQKLVSAGVETTNYELRLLLAAALETELSNLAIYNQEPQPKQIADFEKMIEKRSQHMPADKILGHRGFYKYDFVVNTDVLSPRPDTEILVEAALEWIIKTKATSVLELGIGSGCIVTSLLAEVPSLQATGIDVSPQALAVAKKNADILGVAERLDLVEKDWFADDFMQNLPTDFDLIVSNPPYIPSAEVATLDAEVRNFDPMPALDGGKDGLDSYRKIAELTPALLKQGGNIFLEVGEGQANDVAKIFVNTGLQLVKIIKDLSGIERCVCLKK